jgi:subtilisin family serine protease
MKHALSPLALIVGLLFFTQPGTAAPAGNSLSTRDQKLLAESRVKGQQSVTVMIATVSGSSKNVASDLAALGGSIHYRDDALGYVRAQVPTANVEAIAKIAGVQVLNLDTVIPIPDPRPEKTEDGVQVDPPDSSTPPLNPYLPTRDIGGPQFVAAHPTFDGRGVTIGVVDTGITLDHPSLQTTTTGERKIIDWVRATDPIGDDDPSWINMQDQVSGRTFTYRGVNYRAPSGGSYRIGLFNERDPRLSGPNSEYSVPTPPTGALLGDVNRDGNPPGSSGLFAVLWDPNKNLVWVDVNQNHDFSDDPAMTDYKVHYDIGTFGTDNPATPVHEAVKFVVQTDGKNKYVNIGIVSASHASHVAGIAAGKNLFGAANGVAPGAKLVSVCACLFTPGCTSHALIEGMIYAVKKANVDVVNMSIGGVPPLNDGSSVFAVVYDRLNEQFKTQLFLSAGNDGAGVNTIGDPAVATKVVGVGAYIHRDTLLANYGNIAVKDDGLFFFSSRGPREDGGLKPNLVAPGAAVSSIPLWQAGNPVPGTYSLPPGYAMFNGTSMAAPETTGGAALLVSAAKQTGAQWKPAQLRQAILSSARYLPGYGAHEQGNGLFQIGAAWELLKQNIKTVEILSLAPVKTLLSPFLAVPNFGPGIFEREGWASGQSAVRIIYFARTSGGGPSVRYSLTWVGNDGTFSSAASISLPLNRVVGLPVNVRPLAAGAHSAILNLSDPAAPGTAYQVLNTVVVAEDITSASAFVVTHPGTADRFDKSSFFFRVPPNTPAFKANANGVNGRVRLSRFHPYGLPLDELAGYQTGGSQTLTVERPTPGVWELTVDASRSSAISPATYNILGSLLGAEITPSSVTIDPTVLSATNHQSFTFRNVLGAFTGGAAGGPLGSAFAVRPTIADHAQQLATIAVSTNSVLLDVKIGNPSDTRADLDLYLFLEQDGVPGLSAGDALVGASAGGTAEEEIIINSPPAGTYYALIDGFSVPSGATAYDYIDTVSNPSFGAVTVADPSVAHANGDVWSAPVNIQALTKPAAGRFLRGFVKVIGDSAVIGSAEINLKNVGP